MGKISAAIHQFLFIILLSCTPAGQKEDGAFRKLEFNRVGGGNKQFFILNTNQADQIKVQISKYAFRDTSFAVTLSKSGIDKSIIGALDSLFSGKISVTGNFKQPVLLTGTWSHFYIYSDSSQKSEITNSGLIENLLPLENLVEEEIRKGKK